jgi:hypothetical protein
LTVWFNAATVIIVVEAHENMTAHFVEKRLVALFFLATTVWCISNSLRIKHCCFHVL